MIYPLVRLLLCPVFLIFSVSNCSVLTKEGESEEPCKGVTFKGMEYQVGQFDLEKYELKLTSYEVDSILTIPELLKEEEGILFVTNGGIFEPDFKTSGLLIQEGKLIQDLNVREGKGNFYLKPNGVFFLSQNGKPMIRDAEEFKFYKGEVSMGIQSGPTLVLKGGIHPRFNEGSKNIRLRSGVGVDRDGNIVFAISKGKVNFYDFASLFLDELSCKNALYLDGVISEMYCKDSSKNISEFTQNFGSIIYVKERK